MPIAGLGYGAERGCHSQALDTGFRARARESAYRTAKASEAASELPS